MTVIQNLACDWDADDWRRDAACRNTAPDLFFPVGVTGHAVYQIAAAKAVCQHCSVRSDCLEFALVTNQESGVWGGTTEEERRKVRRLWLARRREANAGGRPKVHSRR
jgi:WhiB family redox-sensing transcriptional regulator